MTVHARLDHLQVENETLRQRVADLEAALGTAFVPPLDWRLTPVEARMVGVLLARPLASLQALTIAAHRDLARDEPSAGTLRAYIFRVRRKLKPYGIRVHCIHGTGYRLDEASRARARALIAAAHGEG